MSSRSLNNLPQDVPLVQTQVKLGTSPEPPSKSTVDLGTGLNWWPLKQSVGVGDKEFDLYARTEGAENKFAIQSPSNPKEYLTVGSQSAQSGITLSPKTKQQVEIAVKSNYPNKDGGDTAIPSTGENTPYKTAGLPNPFSTKIPVAPKGRTPEQVYKDFFSLEKTPDKFKDELGRTRYFWGTFRGEPSTTPLTNNVGPGTFKTEHGTFPLPNLKDNQKHKDGTPFVCGTPREIQEGRDMALRAIVAGRIVAPMSAKYLNHYLTGLGKPLETIVSRNLFDNASNESIGAIPFNKYKENLEQSALRYAQDNPNIKEFTVQGPLMSFDSKDTDVKTAMGQFWAGGRAHYVAERGENGKILLVGHTQLFAVDHYNFRGFGQGMPTLPGEKHGMVEQALFNAMPACKIPGTDTNMAYPFDVYAKEKVRFSRISNY